MPHINGLGTVSSDEANRYTRGFIQNRWAGDNDEDWRPRNKIIAGTIMIGSILAVTIMAIIFEVHPEWKPGSDSKDSSSDAVSTMSNNDHSTNFHHFFLNNPMIFVVMALGIMAGLAAIALVRSSKTNNPYISSARDDKFNGNQPAIEMRNAAGAR